MAAKSVIMIHYPRAAACLYREAKEFKKISSSRRAQHDPLHYGCGMYIYPYAVTSLRHIVVCLLAKTLMNLLYIVFDL